MTSSSVTLSRPVNFKCLASVLVLLTLEITSTLGMNKMPPPDIKLYPQFARECPNGNQDCKFTPKDSSGTVYFSCKQGTIEKDRKFCFCGTGEPPKDELMYPLQWDGTKMACSIAKRGPCGAENGLEVYCRPDLDCIQGRCRNQTEMRSGEKNQYCNDEVDCRQGLSCKESHVPTAVKIKRCY